MKGTCAVVVALLFLGCVAGDTLRPFSRRPVQFDAPYSLGETLWFNQTLDHFNSSNVGSWQQKYIVNSTFYKDSSSPVFFFLGGEAPLEFFGFQEVQIFNWAQEFSALYIGIEHRFYGDSNPLPDYSTESLQYLSSRQALADAANFITTMKDSFNAGKWVVFGCSYSGALSAYFRTLYPDLVVASIAPSGPVQAQLDFPGYFGQFQNSAAPDCVAATAKASAQIVQLLGSSDGRKTLAQYFNACTAEITHEDTYFFLYNIIGDLGSADQMSNPPTWTLNQTCNQLVEGGNFLQNWGEIYTGGSNCSDFNETEFLVEMQDPTNGGRTWTWQTCTEFGFYSTTYPGSSVFPPFLPVGPQVEWCGEIFGIPGLTPDINGTNKFYGGWNLNGTNIMFTNGLLDPWHLLSINHDYPDGSVLAATYEAGHCASLIEASSIDPPTLVAARERVVNFLSTVLQQ